MSNTLFKKVSAAAVVAVLGASAASQAAITPYSTGFETSEGYAPGPLASPPPAAVGQPVTGPQWSGADSDPAALNSVNVVPTNAQTGTNAVQINTATSGGVPPSGTTSATFINHQTDYYNTATAFTSAQIGSSIVSINFGLNRAAPTGVQTTNVNAAPGGTFPFRSSFGVDVYNGAKTNLIASLLVGNSSITATNLTSTPSLFVSTGTAAPTIVPLPVFGAADGSYGNYSLNIDFGNHTFTVSGAGATSAPYAFASTLNDIGGVYLAADSAGTNTAYFDNFSVVPEPASIAMIGIGSLMLVGRRRRQTA